MSAQPEKETHIELGGERLRLWSREHLSAQNVYAAMSDDKLVQQFDRYIERVGEQTPKIISAMRDALKTGEFLPGKPVNDSFLRLSIREGQGYGLGAAWGVSPEADLLWAGTARLMERAGYAPDEPVRMPEPKADPKPGGGSTPPTPGMGRR